jgi:hypothetical protein
MYRRIAASCVLFSFLMLCSGHVSGVQADPTKIIALTNSSVVATDVTGTTTHWTWPLPGPCVPYSSVQVFPDGQQNFRILVAVFPPSGSPTTYCLDSEGALKWQVAGVPASGHENSVLTHNIYTDPDLFPSGPPNVGRTSAPSILINQRAAHFATTNSTVLCMESGTGTTIWSYSTPPGDLWAEGWIPDVNGDGAYDVIIGNQGGGTLTCLSGRDGATPIWSRSDVGRGGVSVGDVSGDGIADYAIGGCCYDDQIFMLNGANGTDVWAPRSYGAFDLMDIKRLPGTPDFLIGAQGSSGGAIRRYSGLDGSVVWECPAAYNNNTLAGLIPTPAGYYVMSDLRHQYRAMCLNAVTGQVIWDNVPQENEFQGRNNLVVPDQDRDGYDDLLVMTGAGVSLYSTRTGTKLSDFGPSGVLALALCVSNEPHIVSITDVPNDQGGKVSIRWIASVLDVAPGNPIDAYWIWRQVPAGLALQALAGRVQPAGASRLLSASGGRVFRTTSDGSQLYYWEYLGSQVAHGFPAYSYTAPTLFDATPDSDPYTLFMVEAEQLETGIYWSSLPDSGHSIDNLAPPSPAVIAATYLDGTASLRWEPSVAPDLARYHVYRDNDPSFSPGPANLMGSTSDTSFVSYAGAPYYYKLSAVDIHGNESGFVTVLPTGTLGAEDRIARGLALAAPRPNPALGDADIRFALSREGPASLEVFDASGRCVRVLASGVMSAGEHSIRFDLADGSGLRSSAGLYFVRLSAEGRQLTRRLVVIR